MIPSTKIAAAALTAAALGFQHGFDYDHVAAIADLTGTVRTFRRALALAMLYGCGHTTVISALGIVAVAFGLSLPSAAEHLVQVLVGLTLIALGIYLLVGLFFGSWSSQQPPGQVQVIDTLGAPMISRIKSDAAVQAVETRPQCSRLGAGSAFTVGMIHGIGAETPTQLGLFVLAAGVGGWNGGFVCVGSFALGLLGMTAMLGALWSTLSSLSAARERARRALIVGIGIYSVVVGLLFTASGLGSIPPAL